MVSKSSVAFESVPARIALPAVRFRRPGGVPQAAVWCPTCRTIHIHGDPGGGATRWRVHDYVDNRFRDHPSEYLLFFVGSVSTPGNAPRLTIDEAIAFDARVNRA